MGGLTNLFGGGGYSAPDIPESKPMPVKQPDDPEAKDIRDIERRKRIAKSGGVSGTLLSNSLGGAGSDGAKTLLGSARG